MAKAISSAELDEIRPRSYLEHKAEQDAFDRITGEHPFVLSRSKYLAARYWFSRGWDAAKKDSQD